MTIEIYSNGVEIGEAANVVEFRAMVKGLDDWSAYGFKRGDLPAADFNFAAANKFSPFNPKGRARLVSATSLNFGG